VLNRRSPLDANLLNSLAPDAAVVAASGIGVDNVDLEAATDLGIPVTNVLDYRFEEVATTPSPSCWPSSGVSSSSID